MWPIVQYGGYLPCTWPIWLQSWSSSTARSNSWVQSQAKSNSWVLQGMTQKAKNILKFSFLITLVYRVKSDRKFCLYVIRFLYIKVGTFYECCNWYMFQCILWNSLFNMSAIGKQSIKKYCNVLKFILRFSWFLEIDCYDFLPSNSIQLIWKDFTDYLFK